jgi:hypothetical protein
VLPFEDCRAIACRPAAFSFDEGRAWSDGDNHNPLNLSPPPTGLRHGMCEPPVFRDDRSRAGLSLEKSGGATTDIGENSSKVLIATNFIVAEASFHRQLFVNRFILASHLGSYHFESHHWQRT